MQKKMGLTIIWGRVVVCAMVGEFIFLVFVKLGICFHSVSGVTVGLFSLCTGFAEPEP